MKLYIYMLENKTFVKLIVAYQSTLLCIEFLNSFVTLLLAVSVYEKYYFIDLLNFFGTPFASRGLSKNITKDK